MRGGQGPRSLPQLLLSLYSSPTLFSPGEVLDSCLHWEHWSETLDEGDGRNCIAKIRGKGVGWIITLLLYTIYLLQISSDPCASQTGSSWQGFHTKGVRNVVVPALDIPGMCIFCRL